LCGKTYCLLLVSATVFEILTLIARQESCAIAKMTTRCALCRWIDWAVADILWSFEIFQDGGRPPSWIWCNQK